MLEGWLDSTIHRTLWLILMGGAIMWLFSALTDRSNDIYSHLRRWWKLSCKS